MNVDSLNKNVKVPTSVHIKQITIDLFGCGSGSLAGDVVQSSCESLVRPTLPWAQMSSQDQYRITAPQIQTLTLHYIVPVPLQARMREIENIYWPVLLLC